MSFQVCDESYVFDIQYFDYLTLLKSILLNYFKMTKLEFDAVLKKWVNTELFQIEGERFIPKFEIT